MKDRFTVRVVRRVGEVPREVWDGLLEAGAVSPFMKWDWLDALEGSGCASDRTGWAPHHIVVEQQDRIVAVCPLYLKSHSMGEFVFDHEWAAYASRLGISYYPKMLVGVPFTPVAGSRFLVDPAIERAEVVALIGRALVEICNSNELSSVHINFCRPDELEVLQQVGFIPKIGIQFHWQNQCYESFDDYLGAFRSDRRNKIRRERRELRHQGIVIRVLDEADVDRRLMRVMFRLYKHHIDGLYYGRQYLNREFFEDIAARDFPHLCPVVAEREGQIIAGTFNVQGSDALYGRYWGAFEEHRYLHFNVCYYAAIEHCIRARLDRFEAGAGGSFKGLRGLEPAKTYSGHYVRDERFRAALNRYLSEERADTIARQELLLEQSPLKK